MTDTIQHAQLMDETYRYQRLINNLTRTYFLLGRDHLIDEMDVQPGARSGARLWHRAQSHDDPQALSQN
ncbi:hypothetical protein [Ruegeria sp. Ofav3-42]|uniref:hypothetical protein n=1 Tax=Ruegeria sp. Ofav3-42 TaxID=2917759 RepID=UPI001EF4DFB8|nr:hypothetical protein [Ruegeria sp. Ofav3-42]MCG7522635.1 hypothetical protein [Ruegeria sp. Ofav3-42]